MQKDFEKWNQLKQKIDSINKQIIYKERDVWWCSFGINIGHEENGKNDFLLDQFWCCENLINRYFLAFL
jgi:hypothetical protein